jgi:hypothetical protein
VRWSRGTCLGGLLATCFMLVSCLAFSWTLKMEAKCSIETSVGSQRIMLGMTKLNSPGILVKTVGTRWNIWTSWRFSLWDEVAEFSVKWNSLQCGCLPGNQLCRQPVSVLRLHFQIVPNATISQPVPRNIFNTCVSTHLTAFHKV